MLDRHLGESLALLAHRVAEVPPLLALDQERRLDAAPVRVLLRGEGDACGRAALEEAESAMRPSRVSVIDSASTGCGATRTRVITRSPRSPTASRSVV